MIHSLSKRQNSAMITLDVGSVAESLFESEIFGHTKGSFTDAKSDRAGKFEAADGGTLFLDEIGNLAYPQQAKILTALQSRRIVRVGSNNPIEVDIRLVAATNKDLHSMVAEGSFREDLLYRINTIQIEVPALRDRAEDIAPLAEFFLDRFARKYDKGAMTISADAQAKLRAHRWPGNVRKLEHAVEKAVIMASEAQLSPDDFYFNAPRSGSSEALPAITLEEMERRFVARSLQRNGRNLTAVAAELGISRPTLYGKMRKYGLE